MKTIDSITFSSPNGRYLNSVNPITLLESWNCLLNRRRFIGPFEHYNSQKQTSGCRSCIILVRILVRITVELYNFSSTWHDDEHRKEQVDKLKDAVEEASKYLPVFTNGSKHPVTDTGETTSTKRHQSGNASSAAGRLEDSGYEVVPDISKTDGDTWVLIKKVQAETVSSSLTLH